MLYGRGRKVLTLWGGRERSSSDSGVRAGRPGDTSLSSWPVLVLLALDKKRELQGRSQAKRKEYTRKRDKGNMMLNSSTVMLERRTCWEKVVEGLTDKQSKEYSAFSYFLCAWHERCFYLMRIQMEKGSGVILVSP